MATLSLLEQRRAQRTAAQRALWTACVVAPSCKHGASNCPASVSTHRLRIRPAMPVTCASPNFAAPAAPVAAVVNFSFASQAATLLETWHHPWRARSAAPSAASMALPLSSEALALSATCTKPWRARPAALPAAPTALPPSSETFGGIALSAMLRTLLPPSAACTRPCLARPAAAPAAPRALPPSSDTFGGTVWLPHSAVLAAVSLAQEARPPEAEPCEELASQLDRAGGKSAASRQLLLLLAAGPKRPVATAALEGMAARTALRASGGITAKAATRSSWPTDARSRTASAGGRFVSIAAASGAGSRRMYRASQISPVSRRMCGLSGLPSSSRSSRDSSPKWSRPGGACTTSAPGTALLRPSTTHASTMPPPSASAMADSSAVLVRTAQAWPTCASLCNSSSTRPSAAAVQVHSFLASAEAVPPNPWFVASIPATVCDGLEVELTGLALALGSTSPRASAAPPGIAAPMAMRASSDR
mmetsp:Transcript_87637/g.283728  ORF Transcript_87637/g.283728 Transcript_87637/m.283728 type:complete len:477 (+) Transcript_87637:14-1444(+)